ncbi:response regulator [Sulfurimonas sp.]|uniref:response regulator n=1 Tax=Sulfurimonas sp. TaxID=2022749 RepID=UPI0025D8F3A8|nr:response regulator [Sulfurimonas sp.]
MKILIIENEIYLAQSIAAKLSELGHICEMCTSTRDAIKSSTYDVVLLSTNINGQDFSPIIETFQKSIIILMVSYISNDTVSKPLSIGAKDYILKPFMIEELIRKINHYQDYDRLKKNNETYDNYLAHIFSSVTQTHNLSNLELPFMISSSFQKNADSFAFEYVKKKNFSMCFVSLSNPKAMMEIEAAPLSSLIYIVDFQTLKKVDRKNFYTLIQDRRAIVSSTDIIDDSEFKVMEIKCEENIFAQGEILPIEEYVKFMILNYQHKLPDTKLSKKLGISRKSLWEKRKKYEIIKKK